MKNLFYSYEPTKSDGIYNIATGQIFPTLSAVHSFAEQNGSSANTWKDARVTVRLIDEGFTTAQGADPNFATIKMIPAFLLSMTKARVVALLAVIVVAVWYWKKKHRG